MDGQTATGIAGRVEQAIGEGTLRPGDQLPSIRDHAAALGVSPTTVAAAYRRLGERGLVYGHRGRGTIVAPGPTPGAHHRSAMPEGLVDAMSGNPDPSSLPDLHGAVCNRAAGTTVRYGNPLLEPKLRTLAAETFTTDSIDATHLTITSGAMHAIELIIATEQFRTGDRLAVEDPGHVPVHQLGRRAAMELVPVEVDAEGMDPRSLQAALRSGVAAVVITPRAQNPTGAALTTNRARLLDDVLRPYPEVLLIQDDHAGPVAGTAPITVSTDRLRWATVRSLGKALGPDLRLALVAGDRLTIDRIEAAVHTGAGWVSHILQGAAVDLLSDPATAGLVKRAAELYSHRRVLMVDTLAAHGATATAPSGLNVWIPVADEQGAIEAARVAGFAIQGGGPYRIDSGPAVRVTITGINDCQIKTLAAALGEHHSSGGAQVRM